MPYSFIRVPEFASDKHGLGLSGAELMMYSLIWSYASEDDAADYHGSIEYSVWRTKYGRSSICNAIKSLLRKDLIRIVGKEPSKHGKPLNKYAINHNKVHEACTRYTAYYAQAANRQTEQIDDDEFDRFMSWYFSAENDNVQFLDEAAKNEPLTCDDEGSEKNNVQFSDVSENKPSSTPEVTPHNVQGMDVIEPQNVQESDVVIKGIPVRNQSIQPTITTTDHAAAGALGATDGRMDGEDKADQVFSELCRISINRNYLANEQGITATRCAYDALIRQGIDASSILDAFRQAQIACEQEGRSKRYFPQLRKWLSNEAAYAIEQAAAAHKKDSAPSPGERLALEDPRYAELRRVWMEKREQWREAMRDGSDGAVCADLLEKMNEAAIACQEYMRAHLSDKEMAA